jgi:hypothetical protein
MDMSCFDGRYVTGDVTPEVLKTQAESRSSERHTGEIERDNFGEEDTATAGQLNLL